MSDTPIKALTGTAQLQPLITGTSPYNGEELPQSLASLPVGSTVSGFVVNRDRQNNPILRTESGDVLVKSDVFLKTGSEVVIRIEATAARAHARIVRVDNQSIQELIQSQQRHAPSQDDEVLQPSIVRGQSAPLPPAPASTGFSSPSATATQGDALLLRASLLQPASNTGQPQDVLLETLLKVPPEVARVLASGQGFVVKVLSSELNILPNTQAPSAPPATVSQAAAPGSPLQAMQKYQAYGAKAPIAPPPFIPSHSSATPAPEAPVSPPPLVAVASSQPAPAQPPLTASLASAPAAPAVTLAPTAAASPSSAPTAPTLPPPPPASPPSASLAPTTASTPQPPATTTSPVSPASVPVATHSDSDALSLLLAATPEPAQAPLATTGTAASPPPVSLSLPNTRPLAAPAETPQQTLPATGTISATVIASEPGGATIVRSPIGIIKLFTSEAPPPGSTLQLQWSAPQAGSALLPTAPVPISKEAQTASLMTTLGSTWDSLQQALAVAQSGQSTPLQNDIAARVPNTRSQLVNSALFFVSALKSGDIRRWLGNALTDRIEDKSPGLLQQLSRDFAALSQLHQHQDQNWQMMAFPLLHDGELHQARLYVRRDTEEKAVQARQSGGLRFLLECSFSQLGQMQLDGLVRTKPHPQFDLIVRSTQTLAKDIQKDIEQIFKTSGDATGYAGQVMFQANPDSFVKPLQHGPAEAPHGSILA